MDEKKVELRDPEKVEPKKEKDLWDKLQIIVQPLNGLLTAAAVAMLGYYTSSVLRQNEAREAGQRVYTELMSNREQADSALRKDMFLSIIETFRNPDSTGASFDSKMLNLELLVYNFHESLNLRPLFAFYERQISAFPEPSRTTYMTRLNLIGREIGTRQLVLLEQVGKKFSRTIDFEMLKASGGFLELMPERLTLGGTEREFQLTVLGVNPQTKEIRMEMGVRTIAGDPQESSAMQLRRFQVGNYDFPMIDNTRLSRDQRASVVITQVSDSSAEITLVYFPGSYAGLKEKASYDEVVEQLRNLGQQPAGKTNTEQTPAGQTK
jgi:hypothetical protein